MTEPRPRHATLAGASFDRRRHALRAPLLALFLASSLAAADALATTFNTARTQRHDHWQSTVLQLGAQRRFRAVETHSYRDAEFSLTYATGVCDLPWLEMRAELGEHQAENRTVNLVPADLRVDEQPLHNGQAELLTERGDSGFYAHFYLPEMPRLIDELHRGATLRLRFRMDEATPWFMTFSLHGAAAAIERAAALCRQDDAASASGAVAR